MSYAIFYAVIVVTSLFAMDKQVDNTIAKSYHMESTLDSIRHREGDDRRVEVTYRYPDKSTSTYFQRPDSSNQEK